MARPECHVFIATSLDGFIARADGAIDWLAVVERPGEDYGFARFFATVDALVMGRKTYDSVVDFDPWPYGDKRMVVVTHHAPASSRHGEEFFSGAIEDLVTRLGGDGVKRIYLDGGIVLSQAFSAKLVDRITVSILPILLGEGTRLTQRIGHDVRLELTEHRAFASGLVQLTYDVSS